MGRRTSKSSRRGNMDRNLPKTVTQQPKKVEVVQPSFMDNVKQGAAMGVGHAATMGAINSVFGNREENISENNQPNTQQNVEKTPSQEFDQCINFLKMFSKCNENNHPQDCQYLIDEHKKCENLNLNKNKF